MTDLTSVEAGDESYRVFSALPENTLYEPTVVGVDEAGRGPVLAGPMVYALSYCTKDLDINEEGFADSKTLNAEERSRIFSRIQLNERIGWATHVLSARSISSKMLARNPINLNEQAHTATIDLVRGLISRGVKVSELYVDTVGPPTTYEARLSRVFPGVRVMVRKKADSLFPIVGAASICAKVTRDRLLEQRAASRGSWGSGYPSDARTSTWLKTSVDPVFGWNSIVRFSWQTAVDCMPKVVEWPEDRFSGVQEEGQLPLSFRREDLSMRSLWFGRPCLEI
ncbi:hypothetical protein V1511DRAFT_454561 [Dipodascopsis uninucleata]